VKKLTGVIHLLPLPGSPRAGDVSMAEHVKVARNGARALAEAGFDAVIVENFGDAPFFATRVPPVTISAMTACVLAAIEAAPKLAVGVNVLRNDAESAIAIARCTGASFVRINVHTGARVTDQGVVQGDAATTLRTRAAIGAESVAIWADVDVKHSSPLGAPRPIAQEVSDVVLRGLADAVLVTGEGTGKTVDLAKLAAVKAATDRPVYVASGATIEALPVLANHADGVIVGTALKRGPAIDPALACAFADAFRAAFR
jgi:membrane complex biogenesis BtpA family protein